MWIGVFESLVVLLIVVFVWRFVSRLFVVPHESASPPVVPHEPASPPDEASVFARIKPRPTLNSSAVALEEPDDEEQ